MEDLLQKHGNKNEVKSENVIEQNKMVGEKVKGVRGCESEDQKKEKKQMFILRGTDSVGQKRAKNIIKKKAQ